ncbi:ubiquitin carboxyl-terminal hydrolase [Anaeramoeba flamelloides]|uniref:Ubiquitin carboxyl-terminal hydrolase n=1 Tax=Anaeramoeba flamelloides TaxID=1746091 RepID=A0ABQ8YEN4_9EUKA|nr:ubiquitin carboxyl-terminal hydrolase [Anaeramoeba flamelloides]
MNYFSDLVFSTNTKQTKTKEYFNFVKNFEKSKQVHVYGIPNYGNTCFANSLLQAFSSSDHLYNYLKSCKIYKTPYHDLLFLAVSNLRVPINQKTALNLQNVITNLLRGETMDFLYGQHDPHELLMSLLSILQDERNTHRTVSSPLHNPKLVGLGSTLRLIERYGDIDTKFGSIPYQFSRSGTNHLGPLHFTSSSTLQCKECLKIGTTRFSSQTNLSLALPEENSKKRNKAIRLTDLLDNYFQDASISDVICHHCSLLNTLNLLKTEKKKNKSKTNGSQIDHWCKRIESLLNAGHSAKNSLLDQCKIPVHVVKQNMKQIHSIRSSPELLCIQIRRNVILPKRGVQVKIQTPISFPFILDLEKYLLAKKIPITSNVNKKNSNKPKKEKGNGNGNEYGNGQKKENGNEDIEKNQKINGNKKIFNLNGSLDSFASCIELSSFSTFSNPKSKAKYSLCSVIRHLGSSPQSGHYVCYRKVTPNLNIKENILDISQDRSNTSWVYISDTDTYPISKSDVLACNQAYMLFYEKI